MSACHIQGARLKTCYSNKNSFASILISGFSDEGFNVFGGSFPRSVFYLNENKVTQGSNSKSDNNVKLSAI